MYACILHSIVPRPFQGCSSSFSYVQRADSLSLTERAKELCRFIHALLVLPAKYNNHLRFDRDNFWAVCSRLKDKPAPTMGKVSRSEWRCHQFPGRPPSSLSLSACRLTDWLDSMRAQKFITSVPAPTFAHIAGDLEERNIKRTFLMGFSDRRQANFTDVSDKKKHCWAFTILN